MTARVAPPELHLRSNNRGWYVWVHVIVAALVMVATMPGRTQGLGLITKPLLIDLHLTQVQYGTITLWATLLGAIFCLPCGWLLDRFGPRLVLAATLASLGAVVIFLSRVQADWWHVSLAAAVSSLQFSLGLFLLVTLTRAFGQSALSVISLNIMGKSTGSSADIAYGVYAFVITVGFVVAFVFAGLALTRWNCDWRSLLAAMGYVLLAAAVTLPWLVRPSVLAAASRQEKADDQRAALRLKSVDFASALRTGTFWVFGLSSALFATVSSGILLFNQLILEERGFAEQVFVDLNPVMLLAGLAGNLATGWLATRWPLGRLLAIAMIALGAALCLFPSVQTLTQVYVYTATMGIIGGMITVLFFGVWAKSFGPGHLGKIQGAAQLLTVVGSAVGPELFGYCHDHYLSYSPIFYMLAPLSGFIGLLAWFTRRPVDVPDANEALSSVDWGRTR